MLYIKLLSQEVKHRLVLLIIAAIAFVLMFHWNGYTVGKMEYGYMLLALVACATILSEDEIDFLIIGHIQLSKVFAIRFIASYISVALIPMFWIFLFTKEPRPIKAIFAFAVTVLIIASIGAFFRVVLKSSLAAMIFALIAFTILLFTAEFGVCSPFNTMSIANIKTFYLNRCVWIGISTILITLSCLILSRQDRYKKKRYLLS